MVQKLYAHWDFSEKMKVVDGGTQGKTLVTFVECADSDVPPAAMTLAAPLSTPASESFDEAQGMALDILRQWGVAPSLRALPRHLSAVVLDTLAQSYA